MIGDFVIEITRPLVVALCIAYIIIHFKSSQDLDQRGYGDSRINEKYSDALMVLCYLLVTTYMYEEVDIMDKQLKEVMFVVRFYWMIWLGKKIHFELINMREREIFGLPIKHAG